MRNPSQEKQPKPKPYIEWGLFNWGLPRGVYRTRRTAIEAAQNKSGEPWRKCRKYFMVRKVKVTPV